MSSLPSQVTILIAGGGPAGLTILATLLNSGISVSDVICLERHSTEYVNAHSRASRAVAVHARTLEVLRESVDSATSRPSNQRLYGKGDLSPVQDRVDSVVESILDHAVTVQTMKIRESGTANVLFSNNFSRVEKETDYPFITVIPQTTTEKVLLARVRTLGGSLYRQWQIEQIVEEDSEPFPLRVNLVHANGSTATIRAKYIVGADGGHSKVRTSAGIDFPGSEYPDSFLVADFRVKNPSWPNFSTDKVMRQGGLFFGKGTMMILIPLPDNVYRIAGPSAGTSSSGMPASISGGHTEDRTPPSLEEVQAYLDERGPNTGTAPDRDNLITDLIWSSRFYLQHRLVPTFHKGRFCLIGDAAHVHSPVGGQGMNMGIRDAASLGHVFADLIKQGDLSYATTGPQLASWALKRRSIVGQVMHATHRMTQMATLRSPVLVWLRNAVFRILARIPWFLTVQARLMTGLALRD